MRFVGVFSIGTDDWPDNETNGHILQLERCFGVPRTPAAQVQIVSRIDRDPVMYYHLRSFNHQQCTVMIPCFGKFWLEQLALYTGAPGASM